MDKLMRLMCPKSWAWLVMPTYSLATDCPSNHPQPHPVLFFVIREINVGLHFWNGSLKLLELPEGKE